ncbi:hypothetical protein [Burkholderia vietnamiensis]|uniref:hypothetical protein n=1 Tax=Burkholderia vietnamiensis TaxID=60552 RepID=UPI001591126A|nr:hypothetical protein [Burkholderia vietnamiensis]
MNFEYPRCTPIPFDSSNDPTVAKNEVFRCRLIAIARHQYLRRADSPPIVMGAFYREQLGLSLWPSQAKLAMDLKVSKAIVARSIQASLLPAEVITAFGGPRGISFRTAETVAALMRELGREVVVRRALTVPSQAAPARVKAILCTGVADIADGITLAFSLGGSGRYIRVDSANIEDVVPHLSALERLVNTLLPSLLGLSPKAK